MKKDDNKGNSTAENNPSNAKVTESLEKSKIMSDTMSKKSSNTGKFKFGKTSNLNNKGVTKNSIWLLLLKSKLFWAFLVLVLAFGTLWYYQKSFLDAQWNKWTVSDRKDESPTITKKQVNPLEKRMQKVEQLFPEIQAKIRSQDDQIKQQKNLIISLQNSLRLIEERELKPSQLLPLIDNHLYLIEQQLIFDYDAAHIERQLNVVFDLLRSLQDPDLAIVISALNDFKQKFIDLPRFNVMNLVADLDAYIAVTKHYQPKVIEQTVTSTDSISAYFKQRLSQLIRVQQENKKQFDLGFDLETRMKWIILQLESIKLRLLLRDWTLVNEQSEGLRLWLQTNQNDLYERFNPLLSRLQFLSDTRVSVSLNEVRSQLNQVMKAKK